MGDRLRAAIPPRYVTKPTRSTHPSTSLGSLNREPALVKAGTSPLPVRSVCLSACLDNNLRTFKTNARDVTQLRIRRARVQPQEIVIFISPQSGSIEIVIQYTQYNTRNKQNSLTQSKVIVRANR